MLRVMSDKPYYRRVFAKSQTKNSRTCSIRECSGVREKDSTSSATPGGRSGASHGLLRPALESIFHALFRALFKTLFRPVLRSLRETVPQALLRSLRETV